MGPDSHLRDLASRSRLLLVHQAQFEQFLGKAGLPDRSRRPGDVADWEALCSLPTKI